MAAANQAPQRLSERDAVDIWIARWLRTPRKEIRSRYNCDPRRLYEIWEGRTFAGTRARAEAEFRERFPTLVGQTDFSLHRRIPRRPPPADDATQLDLFSS